MGNRERVWESDLSVRKLVPASVGGVVAAHVIGRAGAAGTLLGAAFALVVYMAPPSRRARAIGALAPM